MHSSKKLPLGWCIKRLDELARINPEQIGDSTPPDTAIDYIDLGAVEETGGIPKTSRLLFGDAPSRARRKVSCGDILASTVRPYLRGFTRVNRNGNDAITIASTGYAVIHPLNPGDGEFIYQQVLSTGFLTWLLPLMTGSNYPAVSDSDMAAYPLPCPPPDERQQIGESLAAVDNAKAQTQAVIAQTWVVKSTLLQNLLTHGLPKRKTQFRNVSLGEVFQERKERGRSGLPIMSVTMNSGLVERASLDRRMETTLESGDHILARKGDIAYNMMRMWQGVFGLAKRDCLISPAYVVVQPLTGIVPEYASYLFKHPATIRKFHLFSQGLTDDRLRLYFNQFKSIKLKILADEGEQRKIATMLEAVDIRIDSLTEYSKRLSTVKQALSQVLLTGRVRIRSK
jgi:type I restriction enzyme S subunit